MSQKTPLYDWHRQHGAKLVEFGGWQMPVSYEGVLAEHQAVRERCGLFDISHMGEFYVEGPDAENFLQKLTTNDVSRLKDGEAQYSLLLYDRGTAVDDIIVYRLGSERFMLCVNAANIDKDREWLKGHLSGRVTLDDRSPEMGMIALQGPKSAEVLARLGFKLDSLKRFQCVEAALGGVKGLVARTGYTGEEGCEVFLSGKDLLSLWEVFLKAGDNSGIRPIGLGARDTLRLEMGYPLYGHELSDEINPLEAGLSWVVKLEKGDFIGREALVKIKEQGPMRRLVGLVMEEPGIPREGFAVMRGAETIGKTCSGTFSPTLQVGIATALVSPSSGAESGENFIDIRGKMKKAKITKLPFISQKK
ncbi:MAG: glycine cleavage system aminomethyltransferase GcvT [Deltaproteobacteria bacterium]|nr:glycine cleavage system aminomethyltransferase GcvT [Deltaproteobacteria bacterium]